MLESPAAQYVARRLPSLSVSDTAAFQIAKEWTDQCIHQHRKCPDGRLAELPTRVIDVGLDDPDYVPRLCLGSEQGKANYAALSYCWGGPQIIMLTTDTIDAHLKSIPDQLPQSIQDAILVARGLRIQFLWVDSLCIIQDSATDKATEIGKMRTIFRNSTVTIAAASAHTVFDGFLEPRIPPTACKLRLRCPNGSMGTVSLTPHRYYNAMREPINSRAWTMEERILSPRVLVFGQKEMSWQCQTDLSKSITGFHPALTEGCKRLPSYIFDPPSPNKSTVDKKTLFNRALLWIDIVEEYARRDLTHEKDKLIAISGIAAQLELAWEDTYVAGLWRTSLIHHLAWSRHRVPSKTYHSPTAYRAPSWSWASIDGPVGLMMLEEVNAELVSHSISPKRVEAPLGQVTGGKIVLLAARIPFRVTRDWDSWILDLSLDTDSTNALAEDEEEQASLILLGRTFGILVGLILMPSGGGGYKRIGKVSCRKKYESGDAVEPWAELVRGVERERVRIV